MNCSKCKKTNPIIEQYSPDHGKLYFCNKKCFKEFRKEYVYRASPAIYIKTGKQVYKDDWNLFNSFIKKKK